MTSVLRPRLTAARHPLERILAHRLADDLHSHPPREQLDINRNTVWRARARFVAEGIDAPPRGKKAEGRQYRKLDGAREAQLVALACSRPPEGQARWTVRLLSERLVELEVVEAIDPSTVWRTLQKTRRSRGRSSSGSSRRRPTPPSSPRWRTRSRSTTGRPTRSARWCASTGAASN